MTLLHSGIDVVTIRATSCWSSDLTTHDFSMVYGLEENQRPAGVVHICERLGQICEREGCRYAPKVGHATLSWLRCIRGLNRWHSSMLSPNWPEAARAAFACEPPTVRVCHSKGARVTWLSPCVNVRSLGCKAARAWA